MDFKNEFVLLSIVSIVAIVGIITMVVNVDSGNSLSSSSDGAGLAYRFINNTNNTGTPPPLDMDGDGYSPNYDCDDYNSYIYPGAAEICGNYIDENCNGEDQSCGRIQR